MLILLAASMGFLASLLSSILGGGFGILSVPAIYWLMIHFYPNAPHAMQTTIATGGLCSIPLGITASYKQRKYKNIDFKLFRSVVVIMVIGSMFGALLVTFLESDQLKYFFSFMVFIMAAWMLTFKYGRSKTLNLTKHVFNFFAFLVSTISSLVGASIFSVPFFVLSGIEIKKAIGTSTLLVFIYSAISAIWLTCLGIPEIGISLDHIGYANVPILLSAILPCLIGGIVGAKLVHILPSHILKRIFVGMLFTVSITMLL
jgi:uncharacterized protein